MPTDQKRAEILSQFIEFCSAAEPTDPLKLLEFDEDTFANPTDSEHALSALLDVFALSELIECGIAIASENEPPRIASPFDQIGGMFIVLRDVDTNEPYELLTSEGLASGETSIRAALRDAQTRADFDEDDPCLFAAFRVEDVAVLRSCGLPAILAYGLEKLPLDQVDDFCAALGIERNKSDREWARESMDTEQGNNSEDHPDDPIRCMLRREGVLPQGTSPLGAATAQPRGGQRSARQDEKLRLVFVGWQVAMLAAAVPSELQAVVHYFEKLQKYLGVELWDISYWSVEAEDLERLQFIANGKCPQLMKDTFADLAYENLEPLSGYGQPKIKRAAAATDFPTAMAQYYEAGIPRRNGLQCSPEERQRAWTESQRLLSEQVIQPLREYAMSADNPLERTLLLNVADFSQVLHVQTILLADKLNQRIAERGVAGAEPLANEDLKSLLAMTDRLIDIAKAADQCHRQNTIMFPAQILDVPTIPHLPHSD